MTIDAAPTDPRTQRTVARLRRALDELLRTRTLSQITVSELCRTAGVHRTTFYKHHVSVVDFAHVAFGELIDDALRGRGLAEERDATAPDAVAEHRTAIVRLLDHVAANRVTFRRLLGPEGDLMCQRLICDHLTARMLTVLELSGIGTPESRGLAASVLGFAALGMVEQWALGDAEDSAAAADAYLAVISLWQELA
ncbi:hypothetical protein PU560_10010 [Georgenia sp. 10Sc9-8]|uniref:TetR family transcriptional regulator n=1 Tax=Georgenia halotolerans TaxID=3028317 RepID=A0ABT5TXJ5_9MICO|nr:hypothetical protein [Georgenia halotolerans]